MAKQQQTAPKPTPPPSLLIREGSTKATTIEAVTGKKK
jgi:hypothetical protein